MNAWSINGSVNKRIAYYITPHGFGHAVRSLEIIREMLILDPKLDITVASDIPEFLVIQNVGKSLPVRRVRLDVGLAQLDNIRFDLDATLRQLLDLKAREREILQDEMRFYQSEHIDCVVSDVAFLPFRAAGACGIPSVGIGNFTWDWIYERYAESDGAWEAVITWIRRGYKDCGLFLRLPMHGGCCADFSAVEDVPLVARPTRADLQEVRRELNLNSGKKHFLVAFTALDLCREALERLQAMSWARLLYRKPLSLGLLNGICVDDVPVLYQDIVGAVDGVITKPGYGIVSDCLAHGVPMAYSDRGNFREYDVLVREIEGHLPAVHIPSMDLLSGNWEPYLRKLGGSVRKKPRIPLDGGTVCARKILDHMKSAPRQAHGPEESQRLVATIS